MSAVSPLGPVFPAAKTRDQGQAVQRAGKGGVRVTHIGSRGGRNEPLLRQRMVHMAEKGREACGNSSFVATR